MSIKENKIKKTKKDAENNLDLTDLLINKYPEIYEKLKQQAEDNFRSINNEILYLIKTGISLIGA